MEWYWIAIISYISSTILVSLGLGLNERIRGETLDWGETLPVIVFSPLTLVLGILYLIYALFYRLGRGWR